MNLTALILELLATGLYGVKEAVAMVLGIRFLDEVEAVENAKN